MKNIFLSVIIPCYNEEANIKKGSLEFINSFLGKKKFTWEVIVSDDGSTDLGKKIIKGKLESLKKFRLLENKHGGKPYAIYQGIRKANGRFVLFTDMDQSTPIGELDKLLPFREMNFEAIIGSRGLNRKNFPFYRRLGAVVFMAFRKALILPEVNDTQCGFKLFKKIAVEKEFPKLEFFKRDKKIVGWKVTSYDVELLHLIKKSGGKIKEVVVNWEDEDKSTSKGGSLSRYIKESKDMLREILRVKINDMKGLYE